MPAFYEPPPKRCPKCRGNMLVQRDIYGMYGSCMICGYVHDVLTGPVNESRDKGPGRGPGSRPDRAGS